MNKLIVLLLMALILAASIKAAENAKDSIELEMVWKHDGNTTKAPVTTLPKPTKPPHDIWDIWYADVTRLRENVEENEKLLHLLGVLVKGNQHEIEIIENKTLNSMEAEIQDLKQDNARLEAKIKELKNETVTQIKELQTDDAKQGETIKNLTVDLNELKNDTEQDIRELKADDDKQGKKIKNITAEILGLQLNDRILRNNISLQANQIKHLQTDDVKQGKTIRNLKNELKEQGKTISNLTADIKELITEDVKQDKAISNLTVDIKELKTEDDKQDKAISNLTVQNNKLKEEIKVLKTDDVKLNKRVDELERKECQIGEISDGGRNAALEDFNSKENLQVVQQRTHWNVTFDKSFSSKPKILLSPVGFMFEFGFSGWHIWADPISQTGFTLKLQSFDAGFKHVKIRYIACISV